MRLALLMYNKMVATLNAMNKVATSKRHLILIIRKLPSECKLMNLSFKHLLKPRHCFKVDHDIYMNLARIKMAFKI